MVTKRIWTKFTAAGSKNVFATLLARRWCNENQDWCNVRIQILRHYGHPNCTNMFQNIGISLMALKMSGGDLAKATIIALNSGYDIDSTCGIGVL